MNPSSLLKLQTLIQSPTSKRLAISAGALTMVGSTAKGQTISVTATVDWGVGDTTGWDIDQDSTNDWTFSDEGMGPGDSQCFVSSGNFGSGFVLNTGQIVPVTTDTVVGSSNSFGHLACNTLYENGCGGGNSSQLDLFTESVSGTFSGYFGFSFISGASTTHYGVAAFTATGWNENSATDGTFTITEWHYESVAGADFAGVSPVPEPSTAAFGIGMLAFGAAALRRRRRGSAA